MTRGRSMRWSGITRRVLVRAVTVVVLGLMVGIGFPPGPVSAAGWARSARAAAAKRLAGRGTRTARTVLRLDARRDRLTPVTTLSRSRSAFRYTSRVRAAAEKRFGIPKGIHLTSRAKPGRALGAVRAQRRYGLPTTPSRRLLVRLEKGTTVRMNRVLGGARGVGEIRTASKLPRSAIRRVIRLRSK